MITCKTGVQPDRTQKCYVQAPYLSPGFGDLETGTMLSRVLGVGLNRMIERVLWGGLGRECGWVYIEID